LELQSGGGGPKPFIAWMPPTILALQMTSKKVILVANGAWMDTTF